MSGTLRIGAGAEGTTAAPDEGGPAVAGLPRKGTPAREAETEPGTLCGAITEGIEGWEEFPDADGTLPGWGGFVVPDNARPPAAITGAGDLLDLASVFWPRSPEAHKAKMIPRTTNKAAARMIFF